MSLRLLMKLVNSQNRIIDLMSRFVVQIEGGASMGKTDLNKAAETILIPLLNEVYGWNLENINYSEDNNNYPGIDLADERAGICIQITATSTLDKVKHTLEQFAKYDQHKKYAQIIIFILKKKQNSYSNTAIQNIIQNRFRFDPGKDIWDYRTILGDVANFQIDRTLKVQEILEANFGEEKHISNLLIGNSEHEINWRETCRELLKQWKDLTTNVLTRGNGVSFQLDDIFVPLGVVERQQKARHRSDGGSPEHGSELYEEKVIPISQNDFFEQVLRQGQSKNSQGSRIAIIGEPGAGKTTQLQKIGDWILKETDDIPIWIPLAAVGTKTLSKYLLNDWLQTATQELEIPQQYRDELGQLLKTGRVWLLLDGVDEMAIADALHQISIQMREGWLQNVRVVLTCRLNVWDAGKNALDLFDVYRNLDFDYPSEVHQFIDKWFATESELQQKLKSALEQPGKERIRDMVKNPLRLTLLCYSWQLRQGELPETKAGLYEWFVDAFYEWNKGKVPVKLSSEKRKELNLALGELAKEAIDQESSRFRLREKFVDQFLGDADDEDSLFYLALQLGWLNRVGVAEENPLENVYAFFHPTFQEYFAALAIDDWHFFLNHVPHNINEGSYRIFESYWREVILLWIGRNEAPFYSKDMFIENLIFFDKRDDIYWYKAYCLAAECMSEFPSSKYLNSIIDKTIEWSFGYFDSSDNRWKTFISLISSQAKDALGKISNEKIVNRLKNLIGVCSNEDTLLKIADLVGDSAQGKPIAVKVLEHLINTSQFSHTHIEAAKILHKIAPTNLIGKCKLLNLIKGSDYRMSALALNKILIDKREMIEILESKVKMFEQENLDTELLACTLNEVDPNNTFAIDSLIRIISNTEDEFSFRSAISSLGGIPLGGILKSTANKEAIGTLRDLIKSRVDEDDEFLRYEIIINLSRVEPDDPEHLSKLIEVVFYGNELCYWERLDGASVLIQISPNKNLQICIGELLKKMIEENNYTPFCMLASEQLAKIDSGRYFALETLLNIVQTSQSPSDRTDALHTIEKIIAKEDYSRIIKIFKEYLVARTIENDRWFYVDCYQLIWHCAQNMSYPEFYQSWHSSSFTPDAEVSTE